MEITINKDSLGTALKACQKLVPKTIAFPATEYAVLERTHSITSLYYSNLNQSVRMLIDFLAGDNFKYLIPVNNVSEYLKTLPDGVDTNYMYLQPEIDNDVSFLILGIQK